MRKHFGQVWQTLTIKKKILMFTGSIVVVCLLSVLFCLWVVRFSLMDFSTALQENTKSVNFLDALEVEQTLFRDYVQGQGVTREMLDDAMEKTRESLNAVSFDYTEIGEERYEHTWSVRNSYEVYVEKRDEFLEKGRSNATYIKDLYKIYEMQDYIIGYAGDLMTETMEAGSVMYQEKAPNLLRVTGVVIVVGCLLLTIIVALAGLMNTAIIVPVMKLANTSKRIADNDFYVEDVQVENQDELGELVHAFNKMKYATGEYISALEEKRKTLDLLHSEELERLEVENQLEVMKLELLKSQVNPHFLFNTLNVISGMATLEDAQTTEKMIKSLSSLFRYNLKTSDFEVPLARELKVVEDYMYLQQMRFGERISYDVVCTADEERVIVPAFTFQPLVENCIIHGLSHKEEGGRIRIRISQKGSNLLIYIGDTGRGMEREKLESLRGKLKMQKTREEDHVGIGLGNIYRRIYAMYPEGSMEIYSKHKAGTVVKVVIPQKNEVTYVSNIDS